MEKRARYLYQISNESLNLIQFIQRAVRVEPWESTGANLSSAIYPNVSNEKGFRRWKHEISIRDAEVEKKNERERKLQFFYEENHLNTLSVYKFKKKKI